MNSYTSLAYASAGEMLFGTAQHPVLAGHNVAIGGGAVLPEVKFTLPSMLIRNETLSEVRTLYRDIATQVLQKAVNLQQPALVLEFEQLYEMTLHPAWGATITGDLKTVMKECRQSIFAVGDRLDLPAGSLLHLVGEKLKISRTTLELLEEHGFVEGIKIAKSVDRGALETWPKEKLVQVAAEMKRTEEFTYELKGGGTCHGN